MKLKSKTFFSIFFFLLASCSNKIEEFNWSPVKGRLMTRWANTVSPDNVLPEYPRPQMIRKEWINLNGLWEYTVTDLEAKVPLSFEGKILVPFPLESALSGVMKNLQPDQLLWYHKSFKLPPAWKGRHILLHFGSVDWKATVYLNGKEVIEHKGGYDPFSIDITEATNSNDEQELVVKVWDPTDLGRIDTVNAPRQPSGKQRSVPYGAEYSQVSGIWKTVWLEPVPASRIEKFDLVTDIDQQVIRIKVFEKGIDDSCSVVVTAIDDGIEIAKATGKAGKNLTLKIPNPKLWWPESPFLYDLKISLYKSEKKVDEVRGYFGMRKISIGKDANNVTRILLNNKFIFQIGLLDQGYWPDGLYTAPSDSALRYDVELMKKLGFNVARKHGKVEPDRWYYWCDKMGLLVWQDMTPKFPAAGYGKNELYTSPQDASQFELELQNMVNGLRNHPSIVLWTIFNETWGQYDTRRLTAWVKQLDSTRLVNSASGCENFGVGDIIDGHQYPGPGPGPTKTSPAAGPDEWQWEVKAIPGKKRAAVVGEFGGLFLFYPDHSWNKTLKELRPFVDAGYPMLNTSEELTSRYEAMLKTLHEMIQTNGVSGGMFTQFSDVEVEVNGLVTYDRSIIKADTARIKQANRGESAN